MEDRLERYLRFIREVERLKSVEPSKPVFYVGADGEWNSDAIPFRVQ